VRIGSDGYVPLFFEARAEEAPPEADLLAESTALGRTVLREVGDGGEVNRIFVRHEGPRRLLLIDGEQLIGAKQNRVLNASFLVAPGQEIELPVSCVERGRWRYTTGDFVASDTTLSGTARSRKVSRVTRSVITGLGYDAEQRAVWRDVDEYLDSSRVVSLTSSLEDALSLRRGSTGAALDALGAQPQQVGVALVRAGKLLLVDAFASADLYARAHRKVLQGMLADALPGTAPAGARRAVKKALDELSGAAVHRQAAPGCGETLHCQTTHLSASALVDEGLLYHLVVAAA
jgi:hypothetical protein